VSEHGAPAAAADTWAFESPRCRARLIDARDLALYRALHTDPKIMAHIGEVMSIDAVDALFARVLRLNGERPIRARYWCLSDAESGVAIGIHSLLVSTVDSDSAELGMMLLPEWQGRGFGRDARAAILDRLFFGQWPIRPRMAIVSNAFDNLRARALNSALGFEPVETSTSDKSVLSIDGDRWRAARDPNRDGSGPIATILE